MNTHKVIALARKNVNDDQNKVYEANGYDDREDYLSCLAEDYGLDLDTVKVLADLLGPNEDFDGLVSQLEDMG